MDGVETRYPIPEWYPAPRRAWRFYSLGYYFDPGMGEVSHYITPDYDWSGSTGKDDLPAAKLRQGRHVMRLTKNERHAKTEDLIASTSDELKILYITWLLTGEGGVVVTS